MIALRWSATARLRIASNSACCVHVSRSGREGQSMFVTVATHAARNSRCIGGGSFALSVGP